MRRHRSARRGQARGPYGVTTPPAVSEGIDRLLANYQWQEERRGGHCSFGIEYRKRYGVFYAADSTSRSALSFVDLRTGQLFRADSWKKPGRPIGTIQEVG